MIINFFNRRKKKEENLDSLVEMGNAYSEKLAKEKEKEQDIEVQLRREARELELEVMKSRREHDKRMKEEKERKRKEELDKLFGKEIDGVLMQYCNECKDFTAKDTNSKESGDPSSICMKCGQKWYNRLAYMEYRIKILEEEIKNLRAKISLIECATNNNLPYSVISLSPPPPRPPPKQYEVKKEDEQ